MVDNNTLISYFANNPIQYKDLFKRTLHAHSLDTNRKTAPQVSGLVFTLSGEATFSLNGHPYLVNRHTILNAGPSMDIKIETTTNHWEYVVVHYVCFTKSSTLHNNHFSFNYNDQNKVDYLLHQLLRYDQLPGALMQLKCQLYLYQLIETVLFSSKIQTSTNYIEQAIDFINENYKQPITITEIADYIQCDRRKLSYLFEKQIGLSPIQYLTEYRLRQAKQLLRSTNIPINEVAEYVGYNDPYYFCKLFKKHYECTPTQYRKDM